MPAHLVGLNTQLSDLQHLHALSFNTGGSIFGGNFQLSNIVKHDLIIIDDFAFRKTDQRSAEYLYAITDARYGSRSIILTSNRSMSDWGNIFPDPIMAMP